jgi:hypothetical protein
MDLDRGGVFEQNERVYYGPTIGWINVYGFPANITAAGAYNVAPFPSRPTAISVGDLLVNVNGAVSIQLPPAGGRLGIPISIFDIGGFAAAQNITILPDGAETIMGLPSIAIATNYGSFTLWPIQSGGWYTQ